MDVREKLVEILKQAPFEGKVLDEWWFEEKIKKIADHLISNGVTVQEGARPIKEWNEDFGDVLWWKFPIEEPPYVGSPLDEKWPGYHTHWTFIPVPHPPKGE